eukprot:6848191-Prymnesium_polylepis.1
MVNERMRGVNHSPYGKVLQLLGASPRGYGIVGSVGSHPRGKAGKIRIPTPNCEETSKNFTHGA